MKKSTDRSTSLDSDDPQAELTIAECHELMNRFHLARQSLMRLLAEPTVREALLERRDIEHAVELLNEVMEGRLERIRKAMPDYGLPIGVFSPGEFRQRCREWS